MKNYYDELEVSKTASKEIIQKVYKVLAKKYHPDTTKEIDKQAAEEKFKIISEAYEILSDDEKRKKYDLELEQHNPTISYEEYMNVVNQRDYFSTSLRNLQNEINQFNNSLNSNSQYYNFNPQQNYQYNRQTTAFNNSSNKKTYYYTDTGKPASAFDYFKYRIKELFSNLFFFILVIILFILISKFFLSSWLQESFFNKYI